MATDAAAHLYVHIPFCLKKCFYCDFNSYPVASFKEACPGIVKSYLESLPKEAESLRSNLPGVGGTELKTIYIGGGTPTAVPPDDLLSSLGECIKRIGKAPSPATFVNTVAEISLEVNPATVDRHILQRLRSWGINRLSVGVQSFDDSILKSLGRAHSSFDAKDTVILARKEGFENLNIDLIYGCPGQTLKVWQEDLRECVSLEPEHISAYALTLSDEVPLKRMASEGIIRLPGDDLVADMADLAHDFLSTAGYGHYEISNWSKPGYQCRHNLNYWKRGNYLGLGAGAHSHVDGRRWWNVGDPIEYVSSVAENCLPVEGNEYLTDRDKMTEDMILGLRLLLDGVLVNGFRRDTGYSPDEAFPGVIGDLARKGLIETVRDSEGRRLRLTRAAINIANQVFMEFSGTGL